MGAVLIWGCAAFLNVVLLAYLSKKYKESCPSGLVAIAIALAPPVSVILLIVVWIGLIADFVKAIFDVFGGKLD